MCLLDGTSYRYNSANQVIAVTHEGVDERYEYWVSGRRRSATDVSSGLTTSTYWDGAKVANATFSSDSSAQGSWSSSYLEGLTTHARTARNNDEQAQSTAYYVSDRHGSIASTIADDGRGLNVYRYGDYGREKNTPASTRSSITALAQRNPVQYAGERTDPDGLRPLGDRYYDAKQMRFTTRDTAELFDRYAYAGGNPVSFDDPTGTKCQIETPFKVFASAFLTTVAVAIFATTFFAGTATFARIWNAFPLEGWTAIAGRIALVANRAMVFLNAGFTGTLLGDSIAGLWDKAFLRDDVSTDLLIGSFATTGLSLSRK